MFWVKLKIAAAWCRQYWRWLVFVIAVLVSYLLGKRDKENLKEQAKLAKKQYLREKDAIQKAHELEIAKKEEAAKRYSDAVNKIEKKYDEDKWNLTHAKKEQIKALVREAQEDPAEIDRILDEELGIKKS